MFHPVLGTFLQVDGLRRQWHSDHSGGAGFIQETNMVILITTSDKGPPKKRENLPMKDTLQGIHPIAVVHF